MQKKKAEVYKEDLIDKGKSLLDEQIREQKLNDKNIQDILNDVVFLQQFGVNKSNIYKIKSRVEKMASIIERELRK